MSSLLAAEDVVDVKETAVIELVPSDYSVSLIVSTDIEEVREAKAEATVKLVTAQDSIPSLSM